MARLSSSPAARCFCATCPLLWCATRSLLSCATRLAPLCATCPPFLCAACPLLSCATRPLPSCSQVLELGCGWGSWSLFMAAKYPGSRITAVSNSRTQRAFITAEAQ